MKLTVPFIIIFILSISHHTATSKEQFAEYDSCYSKASSFNNINIDSTIYYGFAAYVAAQTTSKPELQISALKLIIKTLIKKGELSHAMLVWQKADSIVSALNLNNMRSEILMYKGLVFQNSGLDAEGLKYFFEAKKMTETSSDKSIIAELDYFIAVTYYNINEMEKSREFAKKAISEDLLENDSISLVKSLALISSTFQSVDSVSYYLKLADNISRQNRFSLYNRAAILNNLALFYKSTSRLKEAKTCYLKAIEITSTNGYIEYLATLYNNYAYLLMSESKFDSAGLVLEKALSISRNLKNEDIEATILDSYSDLYAKTENERKSLEYYKQSVKLKNKNRAKQQVEESLFLSAVFETQKKKQEIEKQKARLYKTNAILFAFIALFAFALAFIIYLRQKAVQRKARITALEQGKKLYIANAMIEGQDAERKRLAMDLHDGIMPMIGSLQLLIDNNFEKNKVLPDVKSTIKEIGADIRELSHRMLPSQLESKGLAASLENYIQLLSQSHPVSIQFYTDLKCRLAAHYEMNIYFLVYEMINNAVKHSTANKIIVQLLDDKEVLNLSVEDNGKGFEPEKDYSGIGLKNIRQRVTYLGGNLVIDSVKGQGTAFLIEIKKLYA